MTGTLVIVGAGQAGFQLALSLRQSAYAGRIVLVGEEGAAYQRPPLSKSYLMGKMDASALLFRPEGFYAENRIERIDEAATAIDRTSRRLLLAGGGSLSYDRLVFATGARRRSLVVEGAHLEGIHGLATRDDADGLKAALVRSRGVVVIGAGFIGLEFAAVARAAGVDVTVIDAAPRVMARAVSAQTSEYFQAAHRAAGVILHLNEGIARIEGSDGRVTGVITATGRFLPADLVLAGIGVVPNDQLAAQAGLATDNGIIVDSYLATVDPNISAIGDCARFPAPSTAALLRLESIQNATDQARCLAARITGSASPYSAVPWFWSEQGECKLQIAGLSMGCDDFVAHKDATGLTVFCFGSSRLMAVETVNRPADHIAARRLMNSNLPRPTVQEVGCARFSLKDFEAAVRKEVGQIAISAPGLPRPRAAHKAAIEACPSSRT